MQDFFFKGYHLFADIYYNSVPLTQYFSQHETYITGTLRKDRVGIPKSVVKKKLIKGGRTWASNNEVLVGKWKDKREVLVISNAHNPEMVHVTNRNGKSRLKLNIVRDYNMGMSGVDCSDQMMSYNTALRRTVRWNKKVGIHLLEMMMNNAHYLFKSQSKIKLQITEFKQYVVEWLIGEPKLPKCFQPVANFHYLFPIPATEKKKNPTRKCVSCSTPTNRRESRYVCAYCEDQPALCVHPCFFNYHSQLGVAT